MSVFEGRQRIGRLEKRKGGYFHLKLPAEVVESLSRKKATRLICTVNGKISIRCGLNHYGDGNFYLILSGNIIEKLGIREGEEASFRIIEDPDQLGVDVPEVLTAFLDQEPEYRKVFHAMTDGKKRSLIYSVARTKNIDLQVVKVMEYLDKEKARLKNF